MEGGQIWNDAVVLANHPDARRDSFSRTLKVPLGTLHENRTRIRLQRAVKDAHKGAFAGSVLANYSVDRALLNLKTYRIQSENITEPLGDALHSES